MDELASTRAVTIATLRDGTTGYLVGLPPEDLPPVRARDLAAAWDAARMAAVALRWSSPRLFRFRRDGADCTELALADADACCWAGAVDATLGLASAYGISVCLRLLGLVDLMATASWAAAWFTLRRDGAEIDPVLVRAAASSKLTSHGRLDEHGLRHLLNGAPRALCSGAAA